MYPFLMIHVLNTPIKTAIQPDDYFIRNRIGPVPWRPTTMTLYPPQYDQPSRQHGVSSLSKGDAPATHSKEDISRLRDNRSCGTAEGYRAQCKKDGHGQSGTTLFPPGDALLQSLSSNPSLWPFEKHLPGYQGPYEILPKGGWITGSDAVSKRGIDLRLFYDEDTGMVKGCVRFDSNASIGKGFSLPVHGGAIETVLDESTAEMGKIAAFPFLATRKISFEIKKLVPTDISLYVECSLVNIKGLRCRVHGKILDAMVNGAVLAECDAELVNMVAFVDKM